MKHILAIAIILLTAILEESTREPNLTELAKIITEEESATQKTLNHLHGNNAYHWSIEPISYFPSSCIKETTLTFDTSLVLNLDTFPKAVMLLPDGTATVAVLSYFDRNGKTSHLLWRLRIHHWDGAWTQTQPALRAVLVVSDQNTPECLQSEY